MQNLFGGRLPAAAARITMPRLFATWESVMAKGQMRAPKEKKKPKADKDKPKQLSAYKQAQMSSSSSGLSAPGKKS
jgi:hypothetical protein